MPQTIITVEGEYEVRHPAERGTVRLTVTDDGPDSEQVLATTTERHATLTRRLEELHDSQSGPVVSWSSEQLRVWGERPWAQDGRRMAVVIHAEAGVEATFSDLTALSDWVGAVSLLDGITIEGIRWTLTESRRQSLTQEARRRAVENAVAKATVYATSLGLGSVTPLALSDPGMLGDGQTAPGPPQPFSARSVAAKANAGPLALNPESIAIAVQVHARFAAS